MRRSSNKSRFLVHLSSPLLAATLAGGMLTTLPLVDGASHPAAAQASIRADFRAALAPYGRWERSRRWGEVWAPNNRQRDWRPYTVGRWVYTDDWGWYWASDPEEDDWGWVVYHYGRWAFDPDLGWVWVSGDDWGPGFVQWRQGTEYIGWAPLGPDEQAVLDDRDQGDVWVFVRARDFTAPRIETVILPQREFTGFVRDTVVVNRTVELRDRRFAVNPGIAPAIIAAAAGRPIRSYEVSPRVLAGTSRIAGATEVRADQLRERPSIRESLRQTTQEIRPATRIAQPQPLGRNEQGRLGANPPRAAVSQAQPGAAQERGNARGNAQLPSQPRTQGLAPRNQPQQGEPSQAERQPPGQRERPNMQGLAPRGEEQRQGAIPERQPQGERQPPRTQGLAPREEQQRQPPQVQRQQAPQQPQVQRQPPAREEQRQPPQVQRQPAPAPQQQPQVQRQPPRTEGLAPRVEQQRQPPQIQRPQAPQVQRPQAPPQQPQAQREPPRTEGFGGQRGGGPAPAAAPQRPAAPPAATEGRGGGGGGPRREQR